MQSGPNFDYNVTRLPAARNTRALLSSATLPDTDFPGTKTSNPSGAVTTLFYWNFIVGAAGIGPVTPTFGIGELWFGRYR